MLPFGPKPPKTVIYNVSGYYVVLNLSSPCPNSQSTI